MNVLIHWSRVGLKLALFGFLAVVAAGLVMMVVVKPSVDEQTGNKVPKERRLIDQAKSDPDSVPVRPSNFLVPADRVPKTQDGRYDTAALALMAHRFEGGIEDGNGPANDKARIPAADRRELVSDISAFLRAWETFQPALPSRDRRGDYRKRLRPWVAPSAFKNVSERKENIQPQRIGPGTKAYIGSQWLGADLTNQTNVRFFDGDEAYVTATGRVRYVDALATSTYADPMHDARFGRSYGLLLRRSGDRWLVTRAVADTLSPQNQ